MSSREFHTMLPSLCPQDLVVSMWLHVPWLTLMDDAYRTKFPNATRLLKSVYDHPTTRKLSPVRGKIQRAVSLSQVASDIISSSRASWYGCL